MTKAAKKVPQYDVTVENHGTLVLIRPMSREARVWIRLKVESPTYFGDALVVEPRYVENLLAGMVSDGLRVY